MTYIRKVRNTIESKILAIDNIALLIKAIPSKKRSDIDIKKVLVLQ